MHGFSRRQSVIATSSAVAEYYASSSVSEDLLYFREVLIFFDFAPTAPHGMLCMLPSFAVGLPDNRSINAV